MARTAVTVTTLAANTAAADTTTNIDATNSHSIDCSAFPLEELVIRITNTTASTKTATIKAGSNPPADAQGQGDLTVSLTDGSTTPQTKTVVLSSARFIQTGSTVNIDIAAGMTGTIAALRIPRNT